MNYPQAPIFSASNYWRGLADAWMERLHGAAPGEAPSVRKGPSLSTAVGLLVTLPIALILAGLAAPVFAPGLAEMLNWAGPNAVALGSGALLSACSVALMVAMPLLIARRIWFHVRDTCTRGHLLKTGARKPVRPPGLQAKG